MKVRSLPLMALCLVFAIDRRADAEVQPEIIPPSAAVVPIVDPREITRGPRGLKQVALTFDAGSEADGFPELLKVLDQLQVRGTFFLTGKWVQRFPAEAKMLVHRQHAIGNHSWSHPEYTGLSDERLLLDLSAADVLLSQCFDQSVRPLFRAPYGDRDERVLRLLGLSGYLSIYWTVDTLDSLEPRKSSAFIARRVIDRSDEDLDGAIILMHVGYRETCEALPAVIHNLRSRGYSFVTLREWLQP